MSMTVGPVTRGGKILFNRRGDVNDMAISRSAQQAPVPRIAPYPLGQGNGLPFASEGHMPLAYIWLSAPVATGMVAKDVPTTEIRPVPT